MKPATGAVLLGWLLLMLVCSVHLAAADPQTRQPFASAPQSAAVDTGQWVEEKSGNYVPLDAFFRNEQGETVTLGQLIDRPTLLLPVYYLCPTSCSFDLANLADAVRKSSRAAGSFRVISMSFNPEEGSKIAALAKPNYTNLLSKDFPTDTWSFLTGDQENILKVTRAIGYRFKRQADFNFIHPSAMVALDKHGQIIKYVYGSFISGDVDLALFEAEQGKPASSIRRLLSFCLPANPRQNQQVFTLIKQGAVVLLAIGGICFLLFLRRKKNAPN